MGSSFIFLHKIWAQVMHTVAKTSLQPFSAVLVAPHFGCHATLPTVQGVLSFQCLTCLPYDYQQIDSFKLSLLSCASGSVSVSTSVSASRIVFHTHSFMQACLHLSAQLSTIWPQCACMQTDRSMQRFCPHNFRVRMHTHNCFHDCTCTRAMWSDAYIPRSTWRWRQLKSSNILLTELVWKHTSLYDPASLDHVDAISNANIWASVFMVLDIPIMTGDDSPNFWISTFPQIWTLNIWVIFRWALISCTHLNVGQKLTPDSPCCMFLGMNGDACCGCGYWMRMEGDIALGQTLQKQKALLNQTQLVPRPSCKPGLAFSTSTCRVLLIGAFALFFSAHFSHFLSQR